MIFISGVHGVGKSYFCNLVKKAAGTETYSASALIAGKKQSGFAKDKLIPDIDDNQQYLLLAVSEIKDAGKNFILDGHFCLLNASGDVQRIAHNAFTMLNPDAIILLTEKSDVIVSRHRKRDSIEVTTQSIENFQQEERAFATKVAADIGAKRFISEGTDGFSKAIDLVNCIFLRHFLKSKSFSQRAKCAILLLEVSL